MAGYGWRRHIRRHAPALFLVVFLVAGCARDQQLTTAVVDEAIINPLPCPESEENGRESASVELEKDETKATAAPTDPLVPVTVARGKSTGECYQLLRPQGSQKIKQGGRCEPQSLPFARCRSGIMSCALGWNNGPLTWFACEKRRGNTSLIPVDGSVMILDVIRRHKMPTGHVAYIEEVVAGDGDLYRIVFSHTNHDRRCSLETNIKARYNRRTKTLDIDSGAWKAWGKGLPVAGFILR